METVKTPAFGDIGQNTEKSLDDTCCYSDSCERPSSNADAKNSQGVKIIIINAKIDSTRKNSKSFLHSKRDDSKFHNTRKQQTSRIGVYNYAWMIGKDDPLRIVQEIKIWLSYLPTPLLGQDMTQYGHKVNF